ncbi:MAG: hypothetical protein KJ638_04980 [Chloroflexi bacterium]|nr:hypothetical protein [Chloroflexota bacterium]
MDVKTLSFDIGAFTGATIHPIAYISAKGGDITILDVQVTGIAAGTSIGLILCTATDVGTPAVSGTLAAWAGTVVYAEGVVFEATISDASLDTGTGNGVWLAVDQTSGTCPASTWVTINYVLGL